MQRHAAFDLFFRTGDLRAAQATGADNLDALRSCLHSFLHSLLHCPAKRDALLQLLGDAAADQYGIQFGLADFLNLEMHLLLVGHLLDQRAQLIDLVAASPDNDARPRREDRYRDLRIRDPLNLDARDARIRQIFVDDPSDGDIFRQDIFVVLVGIPARLPIFDDAQPEADRVYFLSQSDALLRARLSHRPYD